MFACGLWISCYPDIINNNIVSACDVIIKSKFHDIFWYISLYESNQRQNNLNIFPQNYISI